MKFTEERKREAETVERLVCRHFGTSREDLYSNRGKESICNAKCILWYILHYDYGHSYSMMSRNYGKTIRNLNKAIAKIKNGIKEQPYYKNMYDNVHALIEETPTDL